MKNCPVCERPGLAEKLDHCPQCGADLECFGLLDGLREPGDGNDDGHRGRGELFPLPRIKWFLLISLSVVLIGLGSTGAYLGMRIDRLVDRFELRMARLTDDLAALAPVSIQGESTQRPDTMARGKETTSQTGKGRSISLEDGAFAERIADFDRQRAIARRRVEAALAKYRDD